MQGSSFFCIKNSESGIDIDQKKSKLTSRKITISLKFENLDIRQPLVNVSHIDIQT